MQWWKLWLKPCVLFEPPTTSARSNKSNWTFKTDSAAPKNKGKYQKVDDVLPRDKPNLRWASRKKLSLSVTVPTSCPTWLTSIFPFRSHLCHTESDRCYTHSQPTQIQNCSPHKFKINSKHTVLSFNYRDDRYANLCQWMNFLASNRLHA